MLLWMFLASALAGPLELETVLETVDARVPLLAAAEAKLEGASAKVLASRGVYDPKLGAYATVYDSKDPRRMLDASVSSETLYGPSLQAGYRVGTGVYPAYDGRKTADSGEFYGRLELPLLDGLWYGSQRAELDAAMRTVDLEASRLEDKRLQLRLKASEAYWKWVAAGAEVGIALELLGLAELRTTALRKQVEEGARPRIDLLDNERVLFERQAELADARAKLEMAAQTLSLYHRDATGEPIVVSAEQLPDDMERSPALRTLEQDLELALARPEVRAAEWQVAVQKTRVAGARNAMLPDVDVAVEHSVALDGSEIETIGSLKLGSSFIYRKERGKLGAESAALSAAEADLAWARDRAEAEVAAGRAAVEGARLRVEAAAQATERAREVLQLERRRFELGGNQLFTLLLREEKLAKDRKALVKARYEARVAEAVLAAVTGEDL